MRTHWRPQLFAAALIMLSVSGCATDQTSKQIAQDAEETTEVVQNSTTAQTSEAAPTTKADQRERNKCGRPVLQQENIAVSPSAEAVAATEHALTLHSVLIMVLDSGP